MTVSTLGRLPASAEIYASPDAMRVGTVLLYAGEVAPEGFVMADGQGIDRAAPLGIKLAGRFGPGDGSSTYNAPNFNRRFPLGKRSAGLVGEQGGAVDHAHLSASLIGTSHYHLDGTLTMPNHYHHHSLSIPSHTHPYNVNDSRGLRSDYVACPIFQAGSTGARSVAIGGGVNDAVTSGGGPIAPPVIGNTDYAAPAVTGGLAAAEAPWQSINFIVKT